jgi:hypothetical protein
VSKPQLYDENPINDIILQGDVFPEIDFFVTEQKTKRDINVLQAEGDELILPPPGTGVASITDETYPSLQTERAVIKELKFYSKPERRLVAIISQTCDIVDNNYVVVSPIYTIDDYIEKLQEAGEKANTITSNIGYIKSRKGLLEKFYLEPIKNITKDSYIDLNQVNTVIKTVFPLKKRIVSLSHWGRQILNYQLIWIYGRPVVEW